MTAPTAPQNIDVELPEHNAMSVAAANQADKPGS
jgi:hypothetical protein